FELGFLSAFPIFFGPAFPAGSREGEREGEGEGKRPNRRFIPTFSTFLRIRLLFFTPGVATRFLSLRRRAMEQPRKIYFDHEKLDVYQEAIAFVAWVSPVLESLTRAGDVKDQLDRASTSIPLNIAEGNGKYSWKDRCRSFDIATGSAFECAAGLDVL